jgi:hypothetical protein
MEGEIVTGNANEEEYVHLVPEHRQSAAAEGFRALWRLRHCSLEALLVSVHPVLKR